MAPEPRLTSTVTLNVPDELSWLTWPDQVPARDAGIVTVRVGLALGLAVGCGLAVLAAPDGGLGWSLLLCRTWMTSAIATMQTATPTAHQSVTALRVRPWRGGSWAPSGIGGAAAGAARLAPSASTPAGGSSSPRSSITTDRAVGWSGPPDRHRLASSRSGSGSSSRSL